MYECVGVCVAWHIDEPQQIGSTVATYPMLFTVGQGLDLLHSNLSTNHSHTQRLNEMGKIFKIKVEYNS